MESADLKEFEKWIESEEGLKSMDLALERADLIKKDLEECRKIDYRRLDEPVTI